MFSGLRDVFREPFDVILIGFGQFGGELLALCLREHDVSIFPVSPPDRLDGRGGGRLFADSFIYSNIYSNIYTATTTTNNSNINFNTYDDR